MRSRQSGPKIQNLVRTTQIIENGELVSEKTDTVTKRIERVTEPDYIKLYTEAWSGKSGNPIPVGYRPLFLELVTRMSYCEADDHEHSQLVATGGIYQNDIMKALGLTNRDSLQKGLKALCDCNAIRRVQRGTYQINPKYAAKGQWKYNPRVSQSSLEDFSDYYNEQIRMQSKKKDAAVRETDVPMEQRSLDLDHWN